MVGFFLTEVSYSYKINESTYRDMGVLTTVVISGIVPEVAWVDSNSYKINLIWVTHWKQLGGAYKTQ